MMSHYKVGEANELGYIKTQSDEDAERLDEWGIEEYIDRSKVYDSLQNFNSEVITITLSSDYRLFHYEDGHVTLGFESGCNMYPFNESCSMQPFVDLWDKPYKCLFVKTNVGDTDISRLCDLAEKIWEYPEYDIGCPDCFLHKYGATLQIYANSPLPGVYPRCKYELVSVDDDADLSYYPKIRVRDEFALEYYQGYIQKAIFDDLSICARFPCEFEEIIVLNPVDAGDYDDFRAEFIEFLSNIRTKRLTIRINGIGRNIIRLLDVPYTLLASYNIIVEGKSVTIDGLRLQSCRIKRAL